jgi:hypothetical protein
MLFVFRKLNWSMSCRVVYSLWGCHHVDRCCLDSREASTGALQVIKKINEYVGEFIVACSFKNVEDHFTWAFANIYGPNCDGDRRLLWDELASLVSWWSLLWCIGGVLTFVVSLVRNWDKPILV